MGGQNPGLVANTNELSISLKTIPTSDSDHSLGREIEKCTGFLTELDRGNGSSINRAGRRESLISMGTLIGVTGELDDTVQGIISSSGSAALETCVYRKTMDTLELFIAALSEALGDGLESVEVSTDYQERIVRIDLTEAGDWVDVDISPGLAPTVVITWRGTYTTELAPDSNEDATGAIEDGALVVAGIVSGRYSLERTRWSERMVDLDGGLTSLARHRESFIPWILPDVLFQGSDRT